MKIKICGITHIEQAQSAAKLGADYLGLVFCAKSPRYLSIQAAIQIAEASRRSGAIPVAVFSDHGADQILEICRQTQIEIAQLHGDHSRQALPSLPRSLKKIYAFSGVQEINSTIFTYLDPQSDFLLFDSKNQGSGQPLDFRSIKDPSPFRYFLAGGLRANNIEKSLQSISPFGVDLSSGVELSPGVKCPTLVENFISTVRAVNHE